LKVRVSGDKEGREVRGTSLKLYSPYPSSPQMERKTVGKRTSEEGQTWKSCPWE
jgi:hypothetical protein